MILTCPKCTTRFVLSAFVLAPDGRKVKCSNCKETWFQLPDPEELRENFEEKPQEIPESVRPVPKGSNVPAVKPKDDEEGSGGSMVGGAIAAAFVFVLVTAVLLFMNRAVINAWPASHVVYEALGVDVTLPGQGLVFDKMRVSAGHEGSAVLSGSIINLTGEAVRVPMIAADFRDKGGHVLGRTLIEPPAPYIDAEGTMALGARLEDYPEASEVFVRFVLDGGALLQEQGADIKIVGEDGGNTPAPHAGGTAHPSAHEESAESPPHASAPPHQESSH